MLRNRNRKTAPPLKSISSVTKKRTTKKCVQKKPVQKKRSQDLGPSRDRRLNTVTATIYPDSVEEFLHADELSILPSDLTEAAKLNLVRLFFQRTPQSGLFAELCDEKSHGEHATRTAVKLAVCWTLSGFLAGTWQRVDWVSSVIFDICKCFRLVVEDRHVYTPDLEDLVQNMREQLYMISDSPNFKKMTCEEVYRRYTAVFIPEGYLTRRDILDFMPHMEWPLTREEVGQHLLNAYSKDEFLEFDWSRGVAGLIVKCLEFNYEGPAPWWVPKAVKAPKRRASQRGREAERQRVRKI
jgi:hypothetical protein